MRSVNLKGLCVSGLPAFLTRVRFGLIGYIIVFLVCAVAGVTAQSTGKQPSAAAKPTSKGPEKCPGANGLTETEIVDLLNAHNNVRVKLKLPFLVWDCNLADIAQAWAQRGITQHRSDNDYGENLFVADVADITAATAVDRWMHEKQNWDNDVGACTFGKVCSHYTQVVWKKTTRVGCGINRNSPGRWKVLLVCNYDPPGNYFPAPAY